MFGWASTMFVSVPGSELFVAILYGFILWGFQSYKDSEHVLIEL